MSAPALALHEVSVAFGGLRAVEAVTADLPAGSLTAVIGPNGCGKSTLLRAMAQIHSPTGGRVEVLGRPADSYGRRELARTLSLLPQQTTAPAGLTVAELIRRGRHPYHSLWRSSAPGDDAAIEEAIEHAGVGQLLQRPVAELSGGQRQRAWLAMVLAQRTPIVLLDEPTTYLDLAAQYALLDLCADLVAQGRTVVAVLHDLPQAVAYADHTLIMQNGRLIAAGAPPQVVTAERVRDVYGIACRVDLDDPRGPVIAPLPRHLREAPVS